jgi:hypothetical protein
MNHDHEKFTQLKTNLEPGDSFQELIQQKHNAVRQYLENNLASLEGTKLIGSVARKTRIKPRPDKPFDIDVLVILGNFTHWVSSGGVTPVGALETVRSSLTQSPRYQSMGPASDAPTVEFEHRDGIKIELVPAYRDNIGRSPNGVAHFPAGRGFWIPKGSMWELADYDHEANHVVLQNRASENWLIPTVKMLKALRREYFDQLKPFHLEILAARAVPESVAFLKSQDLSISYPQLLLYFFVLAKDRLTELAVFPGSNSPPIMLEQAAAIQIRNMFIRLQDICSNIISTDNEAERVRSWKTLFGDPFPAT